MNSKHHPCLYRLWIGILFAVAIGLGNGCSSALGPVTEPGTVLTGKVIAVHDGDTLTMIVGTNQQVKVRLAWIDAPELGQAFGKASKQALSSKVFSKAVQVKVVDQDQYGRTVGFVYLNSRWVNLEMVQEGWAWHYKHYSKSQELAKAEQAARDKQIGLWTDKDPIPPWEYRHPTHAEQPPKEGEPVPMIKMSW